MDFRDRMTRLAPSCQRLSLALLCLVNWLPAARAEDLRSKELPERPNVILILADDLGYGDLGCFGQKSIKTPNLDRMAAEGMRFTQAYAGSTVCAPSRCALMTGLHGGHASIRGNQEIKPEGQLPMPAETVTVAHLMKQAGYRTALIGKWGLGHPGSVSTPDKMRFDEFFGYNCQRLAHEHYPPSLWRNSEQVPLDRRQYSHDLFTAEAVKFLRENRSKPFFLDLSYTLPHQKLQAPDLGPYADEPWDPKLKTLAAMIGRLDRDVGTIFALLKELDLDRKTLVLFASDNGAAYQDELFAHSGPLRGRKRDLYEGRLEDMRRGRTRSVCGLECLDSGRRCVARFLTHARCRPENFVAIQVIARFDTRLKSECSAKNRRPKSCVISSA